MHEEEVKKIVEKVLTADEILHQQIFGWEWRAPKLELIYNPDMASAEPVGDEAQKDESKSRGVGVRVVTTIIPTAP